MANELFGSRCVCASSLLLVGYRLYPQTTVTLHPQFTVIAGGNGVGKTTLLDALQTVIIADQRVLRLNVASGQDDRDLSGQMMGRVAWAVLAVEGHVSVRAMGVRLERHETGDHVAITPFIIEGIEPGGDLFLDAATGEVTPSLKRLAGKVAMKDVMAQVKPFETVADYHNALFEQGVLSVDLTRGNRQKFAALWKQATRPHMAELHRFLQDVICHQPSRKVSFRDVERLMQQRQEAERQFHHLEKLQQLSRELTGLASEMDTNRRRYLAGDLWAGRQKETETQRGIGKGKGELISLEEAARTLDARLAEMRERVDEIGRKRDLYIREQSHLDRKLKHYQDYEKNRKIIGERETELAEGEKEAPPLQAGIAAMEKQEASLRAEIEQLKVEIAGLAPKEAQLKDELKKWNELQKSLDRARTETGVELQTEFDVDRECRRVGEEKRQVDNLKHMRVELTAREAEAKAHNEAVLHVRRMMDLWPDFFNGKPITQEVLHQALKDLEADRDKLNGRRRDLEAEAKSLRTLVAELSRGRIDLPAGARRLVDSGMATPFSAGYEILDEDEAGRTQQAIGPFIRAVVPHPGTEPAELAGGADPFLIVLSDESGKSGMEVLARSAEGTIAGVGSLAWYTPAGPVLLGAKARETRKREACERIDAVDAEMGALRNKMEANGERSRSILTSLSMLQAYADVSAEGRAAELAAQVTALEARASVVQSRFNLLQRLLGMKERFAYAGSSDKLEHLQSHIAERNGKLAAGNESLNRTETDRKESVKRLEVLRRKESKARTAIDQAKVLCAQLESEEPEEVLLGRVDFGRSEELREKVRELDRERVALGKRLGEDERRRGGMEKDIESKSRFIAGLERDLERYRVEHEEAAKRWIESYPEETPQYAPVTEELQLYRARWDHGEHILKAKLDEAAVQYGVSLGDERPETTASRLLQLLLPDGVDIDRIESECQHLQGVLREIEQKVRGRVEDFRSTIESDIRRLRGNLEKANQVLSRLYFGNIQKIVLRVEPLPSYDALRKLQADQLNLFHAGETIDLREFVERIREFILSESNMRLSEEDLTDYKSYVRISFQALDKDGNTREKGFSTGESLGINLALCFTVLHLLRISEGGKGAPGMLLLAMDEAERLDAKALQTVDDLLEKVHCQLVIASPRPVKVPDSICHVCVPQPQGVTSIALYCMDSSDRDGMV